MTSSQYTEEHVHSNEKIGFSGFIESVSEQIFSRVNQQYMGKQGRTQCTPFSRNDHLTQLLSLK